MEVYDAISDDEVSEIEDPSEEDEDLLEFAVLIAFPRRAKIFRRRPDHFGQWRDHEFLQRFRLQKTTVQFLIDLIKEKITSLTSRNHAVTPAEKMFLTLRYYATGSFIAACGDFIGIHKSTAGKIVLQVSEALASLRPQFIGMPKNMAEVRKTQQKFYSIAKFPKCIGALDCTHVKIRSRGGNDAEIFRNRRGYFSLNIQAICDADLKISNIVARWPGSCHDSTIFRNSAIKGRLENQEFGDSVILDDGGYSPARYLITPIPNPLTEAETLFNESQIRTRNPIERTFGVLKRRFPVLSLGMNVKLNTIQAVIVATAVLHNIAREFRDEVPTVSADIQNEINMTQFDGEVNAVNEGGNRPIHRRRFINYFSSLIE